jgi:hypothetical protein
MGIKFAPKLRRPTPLFSWFIVGNNSSDSFDLLFPQWHILKVERKGNTRSSLKLAILSKTVVGNSALTSST